ncbi:acetyltransferase [Ornithinimicrobium avium]|uniref:Acetyltransferase n=1 Tax=Ornithinimicrobium avium TaxID=2283195 RepID=A0A345NMZ7_9MICO|nr:acetyltransferase [Ornithinimicrobium avium]AXH96405.1 acetyltransferase [Ornithinimicrobium avium]
MDDLLLVGASGLAREVLAVVRQLGSHRVVGVLDDDVALHGTDLDGVPVLGGPEEEAGHPDAQLLLCPGGGYARRALADRLGIVAGRCATVVSPGADLAPDTRLGEGTVVLAGVVATTSVQVGAHVVLMPHVVLTHDTEVADFATLAAGVTLGGRVRVGEAAYLGMSASVRQDLRVGTGAVLGMGAVLLQDLPDHQTWVGVPARPLPLRAAGATA